MLIKNKKASSHLADLEEAFRVLRQYRMKLNLAWRASGVSSCKFLGFVVNELGIKANPEKNPRCARDGAFEEIEATLVLEWKNPSLQPIYISVNRQVLVNLQSLKNQRAGLLSVRSHSTNSKRISTEHPC